MLVLTVGVSLAQTPTYTLRVDSMRLVSVSAPDDALEFGVYLTHTNAPTAFGLAGQQLFFSFNPGILPCNTYTDTTNCVRYQVVGSALPVPYQPRNPSVSTATSPTAVVMRLAINAFQGTPGLDITGATNLLVCRVRMTNKAPGDATFASAYLNLAWRNPPVVAFSTKVFAYIADVNTDITTPPTHSIDSSGLNGEPLPVELASFASTVNRNNVSLTWTTASELNNAGFDVERKLVNGTDWVRAGNVTGNGTTNEAKSYTFNERASTGNYNYRLKQIDFNGNFAYHNLSSEVIVGVPSTYAISQNYPNPFNPSTKIDYDLPYDGKVSITLYDLTGREVSKLVNEVKTAGYYTVQFNASNLSSGMYFYRISAEGTGNSFVTTKKMVLVK
jgi:hypothetical protein